MAKFQVVAGKHHERQSDGSTKIYNKGDVIDLDPKRAAQFVNKFAPVVQDEPAPKVAVKPAAPEASKK
jgi:hypothetical protein